MAHRSEDDGGDEHGATVQAEEEGAAPSGGGAEEQVAALAAAMASVITILDIELVVLGGGFAERLGEPFRLRVEAEVAERAFAGITAPVVRALLGDAGGAIGAALLVEDLA